MKVVSLLILLFSFFSSPTLSSLASPLFFSAFFCSMNHKMNEIPRPAHHLSRSWSLFESGLCTWWSDCSTWWCTCSRLKACRWATRIRSRLVSWRVSLFILFFFLLFVVAQFGLSNDEFFPCSFRPVPFFFFARYSIISSALLFSLSSHLPPFFVCFFRWFFFRAPYRIYREESVRELYRQVCGGVPSPLPRRPDGPHSLRYLGLAREIGRSTSTLASRQFCCSDLLYGGEFSRVASRNKWCIVAFLFRRPCGYSWSSKGM